MTGHPEISEALTRWLDAPDDGPLAPDERNELRDLIRWIREMQRASGAN